MLIELKYVEVEIEPEEIIFKSLSEGDIPVRDVVYMCLEEAGTEEVLKCIEDSNIQEYCENKGIELECSFETIVKNLKKLSQEQRASLLWFIIGINDEEIKKVVTVELVIPKLNNLIQVKRSMNPVWDFMNDYYFCVIENTEVNIRGYSKDEKESFHLWMYDNKRDEELVDAMYASYSELQEAMIKIVGGDVVFPDAESLIKVTRGKYSGKL